MTLLAAVFAPLTCLALQAWILRRWLPEWWSSRLVRGALTVAAGLIGLTGLVLLFSDWTQQTLWWLGGNALAFFLVLGVSNTLGVVLAAAVARLGGAAPSLEAPPASPSPDSEVQTIDAPSSDAPAPTSTRRTALRAAVALPFIGSSMAAAGVAGALSPPRITRWDVPMAGLPPALDGLTVLQITDVHLGTFIHLHHLAQVLEAAEPLAPDLVVLTGDFCDVISLADPALDLVRQLRPRHGTFGIMGNHEYGRGELEIRRAFDRLGLPMLVNQHATVRVSGADLVIGGCDDRVTSHEATDPFYRRAMDLTLDGAAQDSTRLMLCHRPSGFDAAAEHRAHLMLAGHTHGFQAAWSGTSLAEWLLPVRYPLGLYERNGAQLYTSAGFGHWFPARFGCETEAPLLTLRTKAGV